MIAIYTQSTHMKINYSEATDDEVSSSEAIITSSFRAEDSALKRTFAVKRGLASAVRSFYVQDSDDPRKSKNLLPVGFLPWLTQYYDNAGLAYEHIEMRKWPKIDKEYAHALVNGDVVLSGPDGAEYMPRDYQVKAVLIAAKHKVGLLQSPGGSGKGLMLVLLCRLYKEHKILCLFNSIDLVMQTYDNFIKYGFNPAEVGIIQGQNFQDDRRVTIMSVASYEKAYHLFPQIKAIFVDESHNLGSGSGPEMATKVLYACQNAPVRIGLSATNDCIDNPFRQMALYGNLGPIVFEQTTQEKIADGTLVDVDTVMYNVNMPAIACTGNWADSYEQKTITTKKQKAELIAAGKEKFIYKDGSKEYYREMIARGDESKLYVFNNIRNEMIVRHAIENDRVLILYTRREHGEILERMIGEKIGIDKVKRVDGLDDGKTREEAKAFLLADKKNIILASTIFKQGVDIPWISTLIIAGAGKGTTMVVQRFVRITRQHKESGKVKGKVIDYMDNFSSLSLRQSQKRLKAYSEYLGFEVKII